MGLGSWKPSHGLTPWATAKATNDPQSCSSQLSGLEH